MTAAGSIPVDAPLGGWQTGSYALLQTPTAGLSFALADAADATKGEADLTVALGSHTFIKVKVETTVRQEGEQE